MHICRILAATLVVVAAQVCISNVRAHSEFLVYWNIPSFQCKPFRLPAINVTAEYGILQNVDDAFRGQQISILYDPGLFPALFANTTSGQLIRRNGGVPQAGNLTAHLHRFEHDVHALLPDPHNAGLAIIDFELWRPIFRQNFGALQPYQNLSLALMREQLEAGGGNASEKYVRTEAARLFEDGARRFLLETLRLGQRLRPMARWGYYGLPFCFNERKERCAAHIQEENDTTGWLFEGVQIVLPSVYWTEKFAPDNRIGMVRGRVAEARRMASGGGGDQKVLVYHRYVYADSRRYLSMTETLAIFHAIKESGADGIVLWGASGDMNNRTKCEDFREYLLDILGPAAASVVENEPWNAATSLPLARLLFALTILAIVFTSIKVN